MALLDAFRLKNCLKPTVRTVYKQPQILGFRTLVFMNLKILLTKKTNQLKKLM